MAKVLLVSFTPWGSSVLLPCGPGPGRLGIAAGHARCSTRAGRHVGSAVPALSHAQQLTCPARDPVKSARCIGTGFGLLKCGSLRQRRLALLPGSSARFRAQRGWRARDSLVLKIADPGC